MGIKYTFQGYNRETMARAINKDLPISTKHTLEICSAIRRKNLQKAKTFLEQVIIIKTPVGYNKYNKGVGHRKGNLAAGRYPVKAATEILNLLNSVEKNALQKGLSSSDLVIKHICANLASRPWRYGRLKRRKTKRTNVEIVLVEKKTKEDKKGTEEVKKEIPKTEKPKAEVKKAEPQNEVKKTQEDVNSSVPKESNILSKPKVEKKKKEEVKKAEVKDKK